MRERWGRDLSHEERAFFNRMQKHRALEVHELGAATVTGSESAELAVGVNMSGQGFTPWSGMVAHARLPEHYLTLSEGQQVPAIDACHRYLGLLEALVAKFQDDGQLPPRPCAPPHGSAFVIMGPDPRQFQGGG